MVSASVCLITTLGWRYFKYLYKWKTWDPERLSNFLKNAAEWLCRSSTADCSTQKPGSWSLLYVTGLPACPDKWSLTTAGSGQCGLHPLVLVAPGLCGGGSQFWVTTKAHLFAQGSGTCPGTVPCITTLPSRVDSADMTGLACVLFSHACLRAALQRPTLGLCIFIETLPNSRWK